MPEAFQAVMTALDWAYDKAINGLPKLDRAEDLADSYMNKSKTPDEAIESLIHWQIGKASMAGFVSGLGGIATLPVAVPANLLSVLWIQIRMVAAIAHIRGFDIKTDHVKTFVVACLAGTSTMEILRDAGVNLGMKLSEQIISKISGAILMKINRAVGFRLATKAGTKGLINFSQIIPFVGGVIGGSIDGTVTYAIGSAAKATFR